MPGNELCVVIPVFQERANIRPVFQSLCAALDDIDFEAVFVDDSSPDGTAEQVHQLARMDDRVRLILRVRERGLAKACIAGMLSAKAEHICIMDGDGQHDPQVIKALRAALVENGADVASAARQLDALDDHSLSPFRRKLSRLGNAAMSTLLRRPVTDPMSGLFLIRRDSFLALAHTLNDAGFKLLFDILWAGRALKHIEVPFTFAARLSGESKLDFANAWTLLTFVLSKLSLGILPPRFLSFLIVGLTGVAVHFSVLYPLLWAELSFAQSQAGAALIATVSNYLINNLLTFRDRRLHGVALLWGLLKYFLISFVGLAANVALATQSQAHFTELIALSALAGIAIDSVWKFTVSNTLVWRIGRN